MNNEKALEDFAAQFARQLRPGARVYLSGDLGAGKTSFVRAALRALGYSGMVKSPSFTLVEPYCFHDYEIYHADLYRLNTVQELNDIGFCEYFSDHSICFIEWPEKALGYLPSPTHRIDIKIEGENTRILKLTAD